MANKKVRLQERRALVVGLVRRILVRVVSGDLEARDGSNQVRLIYADESALLSDLKTLVDIPDSAPNEQILTAAREWLEQHPAKS